MQKKRQIEPFRASGESFVPEVGPCGSCWESFVPHMRRGWVCGESFVPEVAWRGCCWANNVVLWRSPRAGWRAMAVPWRRPRAPRPGRLDSPALHASAVVGLCAKKFALRARNTPNLTFLRLLGEFCRGLSGGGAVPGESCRAWQPTTVTVPGPGPPLPLPATLYRLRGQTIRCRRRLLHGDGGGFCTTRSLLTACRRRVEPSCSAIPPDWRRRGRGLR